MRWEQGQAVAAHATVLERIRIAAEEMGFECQNSSRSTKGIVAMDSRKIFVNSGQN